MNERKLKYVLDGGGVIGWQRNKTFIPYDNDLDVTVRLDVWTSPKFQEVISELGKGFYGLFSKLLMRNS